MKMLFFILVGLAAVAAAITIIFYTVMYMFMFILTHHFIAAALMGILWFLEMGVLNYLIYDYHGE